MSNSRQSNAVKSPAMMRPLTVDQLEAEIIPLVRDAAAKRPAKVLARATGLPERYIRSLRGGEHQPGTAPFLALAAACPELRMAVARLLGFAPPTVEGFNETLSELKRLVASLPDGMGDGD